MSAGAIASHFADRVMALRSSTLAGTPNGVDAATMTLSQPAGLVVGDVLWAYACHGNTPTGLAGWTPLAAAAMSGVNVTSRSQSWWKYADATDVSAWSHVITIDIAFSGIGACLAFVGGGGAGVEGNSAAAVNGVPTEGAYTAGPLARILHVGSTRNSQTPPTLDRGTDILTHAVDGPQSGGDFGLRITTEVQSAAGGAGPLAVIAGGGNGKHLHAVALTAI